MNIIRSVIKKAFVWRNRCSSTSKRSKTFGCFRVAILGWFMAVFSCFLTIAGEGVHH